MNVQTEALGDVIVLALKKAYREGHQEVAEHLLCALEAMDKSESKAAGARCSASLREAYEHIARERAP